jgi:hypothetical protein
VAIPALTPDHEIASERHADDGVDRAATAIGDGHTSPLLERRRELTVFECVQEQALEHATENPPPMIFVEADR